MHAVRYSHYQQAEDQLRHDAGKIELASDSVDGTFWFLQMSGDGDCFGAG